MALLQLDGLTYKYEKKAQAVLVSLDLSFDKGRIYGIIGKSGAGKTTLLSLLAGLTKPTSGTIHYEGRDITKIDQYKYRSRMVGVVFQGYNLLPHLTALENVILSLDISGKKLGNKKQRAIEILQRVELEGDLIHRKILKLSGGQQQRVAIARALSYDPDILLADEPTGNLDGETQDEVIGIFKKLAYEDNKCIIIVTHSPDVAKEMDEIYELNKK